MRKFKTTILIIRVLVRTLIIAIALRVLPLAKVFTVVRVMRRLGYRDLSNEQKNVLFNWCMRLAWRLAANPCLLHSLTYFSLDKECLLHIGVSSHDSNFHAHAWIETKDLCLSTVPVGSYGKIIELGA